MAQHTPGPWEAREVPPMAAIAIAQVGYMPHGQFFNRSFDGDLTDADRANARLVAAAPELLDALRAMWAFASQLVEAHGMDGDDTMADEQHKVWQEAAGATSAALSKVEG